MAPKTCVVVAFSLRGRLFAVTVIEAVFGVRVGGSGFWSGSDFLTVEMGIVGAAVFMGSLRFSIWVPGFLFSWPLRRGTFL